MNKSTGCTMLPVWEPAYEDEFGWMPSLICKRNQPIRPRGFDQLHYSLNDIFDHNLSFLKYHSERQEHNTSLNLNDQDF